MQGADVVLVVLGYVLGSIPSGYIWSRLVKGVDVRSTGSGNVGGMNVARNVSPLAGILTGVTDAGKGALATWLALSFGSGPAVAMAAAVLAVLGHNYMLFLGFRGGKGLGVTIGSLLVLAPVAIIYAALAIVLASVILRDTNTGTGIGALLIWAAFWLGFHSATWALFGLAVGLVIFSKHVGDVRAYLKGRRQLV